MQDVPQETDAKSIETNFARDNGTVKLEASRLGSKDSTCTDDQLIENFGPNNCLEEQVQFSYDSCVSRVIFADSCITASLLSTKMHVKLTPKPSDE
jgi:hypothetical protein